MWKRLFCFVLVFAILCSDIQAADYIKWVDFDVTLPAMEKALAIDIESHDSERPISWIDLLALAAVHCSGRNVSANAMEQAKGELLDDASLQEQLGERYKYYVYYREAYGAALGGLVGCYAICTKDESGNETWKTTYGLKAFSPIAAGYGYAHYDDFGASRSYGFKRKHLGHDMMGALGTPIVAVEGGTVEAAGWNQYGGWRVGIRSHDKKRYYYYAHLRKDDPFATGIEEGATVNAGDVIGSLALSLFSMNLRRKVQMKSGLMYTTS